MYLSLLSLLLSASGRAGAVRSTAIYSLHCSFSYEPIKKPTSGVAKL